MIGIGIIEDERLVRQSLQGLIGSQVDLELLKASDSVEAFLEGLFENVPDIVLLDINLGKRMTGLEGIRPIRDRFPNVDIVMLTIFDDSDRIFKALCAGASAYLTKRTPFPKVIEAIHVVSRGGSYMSPAIARKVVDHFAPKKTSTTTVLTPRQMQIVEAFTEGLSYKMVATKLLISEETVRDHIKNIYRKLSIHSKAELIAMKMGGELD